MLYQLPNGRVIEISTEQYFEMTDEELEYLIAYNYGETLEDPWFGSILSKGGTSKVEDIHDDTIELTDIPISEKLSDPDIDFQIEED
jgi:hypothetical protein